VNELAVHARSLGINIWEVIDAARTKPFGFLAFTPGPGVGGHCLPVDPTFLSWQIERRLGQPSRFVTMANEINDEMPAYVVRRIQDGLNQRRLAVNGSRVLVLGLAYKKNSNDARETPAAEIIRGLLDLGAQVEVHDTHVVEPLTTVDAPLVDLTAERLAAADAVCLVTDHDDVDYELVVEHAGYVFDTRRRLEPTPNVEIL
jgi:UDP-N-acetyl-D-glucosamine dehydrogenase